MWYYRRVLHFNNSRGDDLMSSEKKSTNTFNLIFIVSAIIVASITTFCIANVLGVADRARITQITEYGIDGKFKVEIGKARPLNQVEASFFLFVGSITSDNKEGLKIGITTKNKDSYLVTIPMQKIKFHQVDNLESSSSASINFYKDGWEVTNTFPENLEETIVQITIEVTPEQYKSLLTS